MNDYKNRLPKNVIAYPISKDLIKRAKNAYKKQPQYKSTKELNPFRDLYGYIGQQGVIEWIESQGFIVEYGDYFDDSNSGDEYDFIWKYEKCDVKTSPTDKDFPRVYRNSRFLVKEGTKKVDRFVFAKVNAEEKLLYIAGTISWADFYGTEENQKPLSKEFESENMKHPCRYILNKDLESFKDFIY